MKNKKRVLVEMSGGVDSSVSAYLLLKKGYDCIGATMKLWSGQDCVKSFNKKKSCCSLNDVLDAKYVAKQLGIPSRVIDMAGEFRKEVIDYFCNEYQRGKTPNPCVVCNNRIKFGKMLDVAKDLGCDYIATGHYAKVEYDEKSKRFKIKRPKDLVKDQSYFLFGLNQDQLSKTVFPMGNYTKQEARSIAEDLGLKVSDKPASQDACFIKEKGYADFLKNEINAQPGLIVDKNGKVLGAHNGVEGFTIGQRKGLEISYSHALYVLEINREKNQIIVGKEDDLKKRELIVDGVNWVGIGALKESRKAKVKIRYQHPLSDAEISRLNGKVKVKFDQPQLAITPGQAAVFYEGDEVLGGGWIV